MKLGGLKLLSCDSGTKYELDGGRARSPGESRNLEIYRGMYFLTELVGPCFISFRTSSSLFLLRDDDHSHRHQALRQLPRVPQLPPAPHAAHKVRHQLQRVREPAELGEGR